MPLRIKPPSLNATAMGCLLQLSPSGRWCQLKVSVIITAVFYFYFILFSTTNDPGTVLPSLVVVVKAGGFRSRDFWAEWRLSGKFCGATAILACEN